MKLRELEPSFLRYEERQEPDPDSGKDTTRRYFVEVPTLAEAEGVEFLCPVCFKKNGGNVGTHHVICWFNGKVSEKVSPKPGRWNPSGTGLDDLTFVPPGAVSVQLLGGCNAHFFIRNGEAVE